MGSDVISSWILAGFGLSLLIGFGVLFWVPWAFSAGKHARQIYLAAGLSFLLLFALSLIALTKAYSFMENKVVAFTSSSFPVLQEQLKSKCWEAYVKVASEKMEDVTVTELAPCMVWAFEQVKTKSVQDDFKAFLPQAGKEMIAGFISIFHGGLAAAFLFAWAIQGSNTTDNNRVPSGPERVPQQKTKKRGR